MRQKISHLNAANSWKLRRFGWSACLVLIFALVIAGLKPGQEAFRQAMVVRGLMQTAAGFTSEEFMNPFVCLRKGVSSSQAQATQQTLSDGYLQGVSMCLAGEQEEGLEKLREAEGESNADVQFAAGLSATDPQTGANRLAAAGLTEDELVIVVRKLANQAGVDPYPAIRMLGRQAKDKPETWSLWVQGSSRLEKDGEWQATLDWINEGLMIAPPEVRSSLYQRAGWISQMRTDKPDYQAALAFYNQALENDGWITPNEEAIAHIHRGEVYRILKDDYGPLLAFQEFNAALKLLPNDYWLFLDFGSLYLRDFKDLGKAEAYYSEAIEINNQFPNGYIGVGDVYKARGDNETAMLWYRQALEKQPDFQPALDRIAQLEGK